MYVESRLAVCSYREKMYSSIFMPTFFRRRGVRVLHVSMSEWAGDILQALGTRYFDSD
jgi:hypothetical protein